MDFLPLKHLKKNELHYTPSLYAFHAGACTAMWIVAAQLTFPPIWSHTHLILLPQRKPRPRL